VGILNEQMTVTTRRERRQQQRRKEQRRSTSGGGGSGGGISQLWIAVGLVVVLVALILGARAAGVFDPAPTPKTDVNAVASSVPTLGTHQTDLGNAHINPGQKGNYPSLPPTSGEHWNQAGVAPAPWGVKTAQLPFEVTTHNLEHGGIVIVYNGLTPDQVSSLQTVVGSLRTNGFNKIILEPYADLTGGKIALTAWNWILKLPAPDDPTIVNFVRQHTDGEAPENGVP